MNTDIVIKKFSNLLSKIELNKPLDEPQVFDLSKFPEIIKCSKECLLVIKKSDLVGLAGSFTVRNIPNTNKYIFYIDYYDNFDLKFNLILKYPQLRKATIVHEFCHFISFAIHINKIDFKNILKDYLQLLDKYQNFAIFLQILSEDGDDDYKEYYDKHFRYCKDDNNDYIDLFEKLLLPTETIISEWNSFNADKIVYNMLVNNETQHYIELLDQLVKTFTEKYLVVHKIALTRLKEDLLDLLSKVKIIDK